LEIVFTYKKVAAWTYIVKYVNQETGEDIIAPVEKTTANESVVENFKAFDEYKVVDATQLIVKKNDNKKEWERRRENKGE